MENKIPVAGLLAVQKYVGETLSAAYSGAGSNDMLPEVFDSLSEQERQELLADFNAWDSQANPDGWEPATRFSSVPDFAWGAYFMRRAKDALSRGVTSRNGSLNSEWILQHDANDHVFIVVECPGRPTLSLDLMNHHGRRGLGIRVDGMGIFHAAVDVKALGPVGGERLFRFCSMCGEKLQLASSRAHECKEEE